jgi:hypothetical protein
VVGSCEHGNEPSGSIKCVEFLGTLSILLASQEALCSMALVQFRLIYYFREGLILLIRKKSDKTQFLWVTIGSTYKVTTGKLNVQYALFTYINICSF